MESRDARWLDIVAVTSLTILIFAGDVKSASVFDWMPVDLTALAMALVAATVALTLWTSRRVPSVPIGGVIFLAALIPGFFVGTANPSTRHTQLLIIISMYTAVSAFLLLRTSGRRKIWLVTLAISGVLVVPLLRTSSGGTLSVDGSGATISAAQMLGVSIVLILVFVMVGHIRGRSLTLLAAAVVAVLDYALITTGARGPTIAMVSTLVFMVVALPTRLWKRAAVVGLLQFVVLLLAFAGPPIFDALGSTGAQGDPGSTGVEQAPGSSGVEQAPGSAGAERMRVAASGSLGESPRFKLWESSLLAIPETPAGSGWGNFWSVLTPETRLDSGYVQHPHNIILEGYVEGGWVAGIAITTLLALALRRQFWSAKRDSIEGALFAVTVFYVLCSMVSGSMADNRAMFAVVLAVFALHGSRGPQAEHAVSENDA